MDNAKRIKSIKWAAVLSSHATTSCSRVVQFTGPRRTNWGGTGFVHRGGVAFCGVGCRVFFLRGCKADFLGVGLLGAVILSSRRSAWCFAVGKSGAVQEKLSAVLDCSSTRYASEILIWHRQQSAVESHRRMVIGAPHSGHAQEATCPFSHLGSLKPVILADSVGRFEQRDGEPAFVVTVYLFAHSLHRLMPAQWYKGIGWAA